MTSKGRIYSRDIILILAASFFFMTCPMLVTPLITGFAGTLGAGAAMMGIIGGLMNICSLLCRPFMGNLADKVRKYNLACWGAIFLIAACVGYVFAADPLTVVLSRVINGLGFACCSICLSTWLSTLLPRDMIGSGMGLYGAMNALAMAVAPAVGVSVYQRLGYRAAFVLATVFALFIMVVIQFIKDKGEPETPENKRKTFLPPLKNMKLAEKGVIPIALIVMLFTIPYCITQSFLVNYVEAKGLAVSVSLFFPAYAIILMVLRLSLRRLFDKLPFKVFLFAGCLSSGGGIGALAFMENNIHLLLAAFFMAGGYGIMCSVCQSTAILLAGSGKRGLANGTYYIGLDLGLGLGPVIGGLLLGSVGVRWLYPVMLITLPAELAVYFFSGLRKAENV